MSSSQGVDLRGVDLRGVDLRGVDFSAMQNALDPSLFAGIPVAQRAQVQAATGALFRDLASGKNGAEAAQELLEAAGVPNREAREAFAAMPIPPLQPLAFSPYVPLAASSSLASIHQSQLRGKPSDAPFIEEYNPDEDDDDESEVSERASGAQAGRVVQFGIAPPPSLNTLVDKVQDRSFLYHLSDRRADQGEKIVYDTEKKVWSYSPKHTEGKQISLLKKVLVIGHKELKGLAQDKIDGADALAKLSYCNDAYIGLEAIKTNWDKKVKTLSCIKRIGIALYNFWPFSKSVPRMTEKIKKELILKAAQVTNKELIEGKLKVHEENDKLSHEFFKKVLAVQVKLMKTKN